MYSDPVVIFEEDGEDEAAMISEFVALSAAHPKEPPAEITKYIFKKLRDPDVRGFQASIVWSRDLEIKERIRLARINGINETKELTLPQWEAEVLALTRDTNISATDKKAALEGYMNIAAIKGWVKKAIEKTIDDKRAPFPQIVFAQYND